MKNIYFLFLALLIIPERLYVQTMSIPANNLGRIVEVATPNGVLPRAHVLIGWDSVGLIKQSSSQNLFRIFSNIPNLTYRNRNENAISFNRNNLFCAPTGHYSIEIRFGDSSFYWINNTTQGGNLSSQKAPFSVYLTEPRTITNKTVTGGNKICFKVVDQDGNNLYTPGERILIYSDIVMPLDSLYANVGLNLTNPFFASQALIYDLRFGKASVPYTQASFTLSTDGYMPEAGTVIRFIAQTADTAAPYAVLPPMVQDTGEVTYPPVSYYSFEKPQFELVQAPPRMTIDTNGVIKWRTYEYQRGFVYNSLLRLRNSAGVRDIPFSASVRVSLPPDTGLVEYRTEYSENLIRFWQRNDASIGYRPTQSQFGMEYPKGSGYVLNYAGGLYIGAKKPGVGGAPDTITVSNCEFSSEYQPGRIVNSGPFGSLIAEDYRLNPTFFVLPENAHNWPNEAPKNLNGFPLQLSGKDTWTVFNDLDITRQAPDGDDPLLFAPGLGIEVQRQTFQFGHYPFNNAVLVRYVIVNKSDRTYHDAYFGLWNDPDVGSEYSDDRVMVDSALSLLTIYNTPSDISRIAMGIVLLQGGAISGSSADTAKIITIGKEGFLLQRKVGKKEHRATAAIAYPNPAGEPTRNRGDRTRYWYMQGLDQLGNPKPGGPFDLIAGSFISDQRVIFSCGPFNLAAGDTQEIWMAYIGGQGVDNASAVDTVRSYAIKIIDDFKNNRIDQTGPNLTLYALSTQALNRVRFVVYPSETVESISLMAGNDMLNLTPYKNIYMADYSIFRAGDIPIQARGTDLAGNTTTVNKTYRVSAMNKPVSVGRYTFYSGGEGYLLTADVEAGRLPEGCILIGEPLEWLATQNSGKMKVEFSYSASDLLRVREYADYADEKNLSFYSWDGVKWERIETVVTSNKLSAPAKGMAIAVFYNSHEGNAPQRFALEPNYPNPFNPSTVIRYQLASHSKVVLKIYNTMGQEVQTLVNTHQEAGRYSVMWDGRNYQGQRVASGIYLYRLEAGNFVKTRKMILVK